jgi:hypothetical protein
MKSIIIYLSKDKSRQQVIKLHETFNGDFAELANFITNNQHYGFKII